MQRRVLPLVIYKKNNLLLTCYKAQCQAAICVQKARVECPHLRNRRDSTSAYNRSTPEREKKRTQH